MLFWKILISAWAYLRLYTIYVNGYWENLNEIPMEYLEEMEERSLKRGRHWKQ